MIMKVGGREQIPKILIILISLVYEKQSNYASTDL